MTEADMMNQIGEAAVERRVHIPYGVMQILG